MVYSLERANISYEASFNFGKNQNSVEHEKTKLHIKADWLQKLYTRFCWPFVSIQSNFANQVSSVAGLEGGFLYQADIDDI